MAQVLQASLRTLSGLPSESLFGWNIPELALPGTAIEWDEWSTEPFPGLAFFPHYRTFTLLEPAYHAPTVRVRDQNDHAWPVWLGYDQDEHRYRTFWSTRTRRWMPRIVRVDLINPSIAINVFQLGLWWQATGQQQMRFANVRLTRYRQTIRWLWRAGMPIPANSWSGQAAPVTPALNFPNGQSIVEMTGEYPEFCMDSDSTVELLDDLQLDRAVGGNLRGRDYHDRVRRRFQITHGRLSLYDRQSLESFYAVHHAEPFLFQHWPSSPGGTPPHQVVFERAPTFKEHPNMRGEYQAQVILAEV